MAKPAARWMAQAGQDLFRDDMLIAPVPLHWSRLVEAALQPVGPVGAASGASDRVGSVSGPCWCGGCGPRSLDGKTAAQRAETLSGAIVAHPKRGHRVQGRDVLLVDDVMTSGATLAACARVCLAAGANHIFVLALARVAKDA